jgi:hypothetical protein
MRAADSIQFLRIAEKEMQRSLFAGVPLPELLNRICNALDCEIGNVVSLVSIVDDETTDVAAIAGNASHFGLHLFCSRCVVSANRGLLGKLEVYSCQPGMPNRRELDLIKRAAWLATVAIESGNELPEDDGALAAGMHPNRNRLPDRAETVH